MFMKLTGIAVAAVGILFCMGADAQSYPVKPVRVIVPFPAGGAVDVGMRAVGAKLSDIWKQPVIVENRGGAGGNIGADIVAKAAPDGYTLGGCTPTNMTANPRLFDRPLFNVEKDIAPISQFIEHPWLLYVNAKLPARTLASLSLWPRRRRGRSATPPGAWVRSRI
jgi:tripartite-type tricarboxylate transporter receptor subunit TctC